MLCKLLVFIKSKVIIVCPKSAFRSLTCLSKVCVWFELLGRVYQVFLVEALRAWSDNLWRFQKRVGLGCNASSLRGWVRLENCGNRSSFHDMLAELRASDFTLRNTVHLLGDSTLAANVRNLVSLWRSWPSIKTRCRSHIVAWVTLCINSIDFASFFCHFSQLTPELWRFVGRAVSIHIGWCLCSCLFLCCNFRGSLSSSRSWFAELIVHRSVLEHSGWGWGHARMHRGRSIHCCIAGTVLNTKSSGRAHIFPLERAFERWVKLGLAHEIVAWHLVERSSPLIAILCLKVSTSSAIHIDGVADWVWGLACLEHKRVLLVWGTTNARLPVICHAGWLLCDSPSSVSRRGSTYARCLFLKAFLHFAEALSPTEVMYEVEIDFNVNIL